MALGCTSTSQGLYLNNIVLQDRCDLSIEYGNGNPYSYGDISFNLISGYIYFIIITTIRVNIKDRHNSLT
jgi:hypothetical protein